MKGYRIFICACAAMEGYFLCLFSTGGMTGFAWIEVVLILLGLGLILTEPKA